MTTIPVVSQGKDDEAKAIRKLVDLVDPILERTASEIFVRYADLLLTEPGAYVMPAVWGHGCGDGKLTPHQMAIHHLAAPAIAEAIDVLQMKNLDAAQEFVLHYILGNMIVMKVMGMVECCRKTLLSWDGDGKERIFEMFIPPGA